MEQLTPALSFQQEVCYQQFTKMFCSPITKARLYINRCAGVTGGTSQRLHDRIAQQILKSIRNKSIPSRILLTRKCKAIISAIHNCDSALALFLLQNDEFVKFYYD